MNDEDKTGGPRYGVSWEAAPADADDDNADDGDDGGFVDLDLLIESVETRPDGVIRIVARRGAGEDAIGIEVEYRARHTPIV
jgi:hypothetical protein